MLDRARRDRRSRRRTGAGADDYLVKSFALRELLARACARCCAGRAMRRDDEQEQRTLAFEDLRLDRLAHEAWRLAIGLLA